MSFSAFTSDLESLQSCACPDWFRDAKFGIWSHWGPQAVPRHGDWYARRMYLQGDDFYQFHVEKYGHPTQFGYKDIIPLWRAEKFDPDALMEQYVAAGAKYFVSMGVHHDNFDLWNSRHHRWNAVEMGPMRDIVGDWKAAADKFGLPFGVSEHLGASYNWFAPSHGADETGPLAGVPYDGERPEFADLYHPTGPMSERQHVYDSIMADRWYSNDARWAQTWLARVEDLLDNYQPDLLYTDGGVPFGAVGREMIAHFFNGNAERNGGSCQAVYNHKMFGSGEFFPDLSVTDVERGGVPGIQARPWQCDTSLGDWYYSDGFRYKTTAQIIHQLADVVSKNGTLLLNVVQYADGSLPPEPQQFLREMAQWMPFNGEAIYGTRPWKVFGEGPTKMKTGHFQEDFPFTAQDFRFTAKGDAVYALSLGVPSGEVRIESLGRAAGLESRAVQEVRLLGHADKLKWSQEAGALEIQFPARFEGAHAVVFEVRFVGQ
ncbi:MAG TPA: alpha-L-fucosidase [Abditibacterium sp.]|jgi:alpha-L-fucosidase